jgi:hypothetical protein
MPRSNHGAHMGRHSGSRLGRYKSPEQDPDRAPSGYRVYGAARTPLFHLMTESSIESEDWMAICGLAVSPGRRTRVWGLDDAYCPACEKVARPQ